MLERVTSPCLDPLLLRAFQRFETPLRTTRLLGRAFWHRRGDDLDVPDWWLDYLKTTRDSSRRSHGKSVISLAHYGVLPIVPREAAAEQQQSRHFISSSKRTYVMNPIRLKQAVRTAVYWNKDTSTTLEHNSPDYIGANYAANGGQDNHDAQDIFKPAGNDASIPEMSPEITFEEVVNAEDYDRTQDAWELFLSNSLSPSRSRRLVRFLCSSARRSDRQRGLSLFMSLSHDQRSRSSYTAAVKASAKAHDNARAIMTNQEALTRAAGLESSQFLLTYFVKHQYWKSAAKVWSQLLEYQSNTDQKAQKPLSPNPTDQHLRVFCKGVDEMVELPGHLLSLCRKLQERQAVLRFEEGPIKALAAGLLGRVVSSSQIMAVITADEFLAILGIFIDMKLPVSRVHFAAIRTLWALRKMRNRSELAMVIYRNQRCRDPHVVVHRGVLGSLLSMCADGEHPAAVYDLLLKQFETFYGVPDQDAYQKAMTGCARQGDVKAVERFLERLCTHHGKPVDPDFLTPLLYVHASAGDVAATQQHFDQLENLYGMTPNTVCWNILLHAYARVDDVQGCFTKLKEMQDAGIALNQISFGTLMGVCSRRGDTDALHELGALARWYKVRGSTVMVDCLAESYCVNGELDKAERLVEHATRTNPSETPTRMWNTLLRHHAFRVDTASMIRIQNRMYEMGVKPDSMTYAAMMAALVELGRTDDAAKLLRSLDLDHNLSATLFHYSLVLHGFLKEKKRDMAAIIYQKVLERFPHLGRGVRRSMYRLQAGRDPRPSPRNATRIAWTDRLKAVHALDIFAEALPSPLPAELSPKAPQPRLGRRKGRDSLISRSQEFVIGLCLARGRYEDAELLLSRYENTIEEDGPARTQPQRYLELLRLSLVVNSGLGRWSKVDNVWEQSLTFATSGALSMAVQIRKAWPFDTTSREPRHSLDDGRQAPSVDLNTFPEQYAPRVLFPLRHMLQASFSAYMSALSQQNRTSEIEARIDALQQRGFALTGANWNEYIQLLAKSANPKDQLLAFSHFERQLLPNAMTQDNSRNRSGVSYEDESLPAGRVFPERSIPTYATVTTLRACMKKLRVAQPESMSTLYDDLRQSSPFPLRWLRRSAAYGFDQSPRFRKGNHKELSSRVVDTTDRARTKGSSSPLDEIPIDYLVELYDFARASQQGKPTSYGTHLTVRYHKSDQIDLEALALAEKISGSITRSAKLIGNESRLETNQEKDQRVAAEVTQKLTFLDQALEAIIKGITNVNDQTGKPYVDALGSADSDAAAFLGSTITQEALATEAQYRANENESDGLQSGDPDEHGVVEFIFYDPYPARSLEDKHAAAEGPKVLQ